MSLETGIVGVVIRPLTLHGDGRGWLAEVFRQDDLEEALWPAMSYVSLTLPGVARGPHAHREQTDCFCFLGPSTFRVYLWDDRPQSPTRGRHWRGEAGEERPLAVIVPQGVVHGYRNIGAVPGLVLNLPNRLYRGWGRSRPVDEVRYEDEPASPFRME
jgi:dTDP-4-dehydrorhamnose 3,5-epimerase